MTVSLASPKDMSFQWQLKGKITVIDNGVRLPYQSNFLDLVALNTLNIIAFDPASRLSGRTDLMGIEDFQGFPHMTLGDGTPGTLYACLDADMSGTLEPLAADQLLVPSKKHAQLLASVPINTVALDNIEGLNELDWLILDGLNDCQSILSNGKNILNNTLLIQIQISFIPSHHKQPCFASINDWMQKNGFSFYRFNEVNYHSHLPTNIELEKEQSTRIKSADAIFVPSRERIELFSKERLEKLAFISDAIFGIHDLTYELLAYNTPEIAKKYLTSRGYINQYDSENDTFILTATYSPAPW